MATYYVDGTSGSNTYNGTSPVFTSGTTGPKLTMTAGEALLTTLTASPAAMPTPHILAHSPMAQCVHQWERVNVTTPFYRCLKCGAQREPKDG